MIGTPWFESSVVRAWRTGLSGLECDRFASTHLLAHPVVREASSCQLKRRVRFQPQNQIPIDKDKLKEEQKAELKAATDAYDVTP